MAFAGMFLMALFFFLIILGGSSLIGLILLIIALVQGNKVRKMRGPKRTGKVWVLSILGGVFMLPLIGFIMFMGYAMAAGQWEAHNSLAENVNEGNYARVEALLKKGVDPDCTVDSNKPAQDGERTLLSYMCENDGFMDQFEDSVDGQVTDEELEMMQLLIDYGADIDYVSYRDSKEYERHTYQEETDVYLTTDRCGFTPLHYAVYSGDLEVVKLLVENGADVNATDYCGYAPIHVAVDFLYGQEGAEILQYLIGQGADLTAETNYGQSVVFLAWRNEIEENSPMGEVLAENYEMMFP